MKELSQRDIAKSSIKHLESSGKSLDTIILEINAKREELAEKIRRHSYETQAGIDALSSGAEKNKFSEERSYIYKNLSFAYDVTILVYKHFEAKNRKLFINKKVCHE